jgi:hypothetical protein
MLKAESHMSSRLKAESSKGAFGCWRSASLEVGGWRRIGRGEKGEK